LNDGGALGRLGFGAAFVKRAAGVFGGLWFTVSFCATSVRIANSTIFRSRGSMCGAKTFRVVLAARLAA
jgi:hypothetical protein